MLTVVFFVGQTVAQAASTVPYSLAGNNISDLGNTACGIFTQGRYRADVCSPLHHVMNATFVVTGLLTLGGAIGSRQLYGLLVGLVAAFIGLILALSDRDRSSSGYC